MQPVPSRPTWKNAMHLGFRRGRTLRVHFIEKVALILLRAYNYIAMDFKTCLIKCDMEDALELFCRRFGKQTEKTNISLSCIRIGRIVHSPVA